MSKAKDRIFRGTYEVTISEQEKLRQLLDNLIVEARPIEDEEERKQYLLLLSRSTLGVGVSENIDASQYDGEGTIHNFEKTARWAAYLTEKVVEQPVWSEPPSADGYEIRIENLWKALRATFFAVAPRAVTLAVKASPERMPKTKSGAYPWKPGKER